MPVLPAWLDDPAAELLTAEQMSFLLNNPDIDAMSVLNVVRRKREEDALAASAPPSAPSIPQDEGNSMAIEPDFAPGSSLTEVESSILKNVDRPATPVALGKRPQPPSPSASAVLSSSPARVKDWAEDDTSGFPAPTPGPSQDWDSYFKSFQDCLASLDLNNPNTPKFLGTILIGLMNLTQDSKVRAISLDGDFTVQDCLDALPRSSKGAPTPTPKPKEPASRQVPKPHVKRVKIEPAPVSVESKDPVRAKKVTPAPPSLSKRPPPSEAPAVSVAKPAPKRSKPRQGPHTVHGTSRRGIIITPPGGMHICATRFSPTLLNEINVKLEKDLKVADLFLTHAVPHGKAVFINTTRVPTSSEVAFVLKHIRSHFTVP